MLTSVVQVPANTGAAHDHASRSTGARRARAHPLNATPAAMVSRMTLVVTDRSADMARRARAAMVDVRKAPATANNSSLLITVSRKSPVTVVGTAASKKARAMVVRNPPATAGASLLLDKRVAMGEDVAMAVKRLLAETGCLEVSVVTTSLAREASVKSTTAAVATTTTMSTATAGRREVATVAAAVMEVRRRATVEGTRVRTCMACVMRLIRPFAFEPLSTLMAHVCSASASMASSQ